MLLLGLNFSIVCFSIYHIFFFIVFIALHENVIKVHWICVVLCSVAQSCLTLCDPVDCSPPGSSVRGVLPARILEWVAMISSRGSSQPRDWTCITCVSCTVVRFFTHWATWEAHTEYTLGLFVKELSMKTNVLFYLKKSCPTLWDPMDCSLSGSSIHGIFQARVLEWVAIAFSEQ